MTCPDFKHLLVLPHMRVQNANAISSPLTHGFPSITAFLGLMWALERKTRAAGWDIAFKAVGVICHDHQEQVNKGDGFAKRFNLVRQGGSVEYTRVEEGRIHLDISLVFAVSSERWSREPDTRDAYIVKIAELLAAMRIAGGTLLPPVKPWQQRYQPFVIDLTGNEDDRRTEFRKKRMHLLPGFALVARDDLLETRLAELCKENESATKLDAWLALSRINWKCHASENGKSEWQHDRKGLGWVVPIPVGYGALDDLFDAGTVTNARDAETPFRFVESLYSVGQWVSPHHLHDPGQLLWYADSQPDNGLYRCRNDYRTKSYAPNFFDEID